MRQIKRRNKLPKPYFETDLGKLYHGDCIYILPLLPKVDLVLTDPPYKVGWDKINKYGSNRKARAGIYGKQKWDSSKFSKKQFNTIKAKSNNQIIFGANHFSSILPDSSCWIVWDKDNTGNYADCELAWTSFNTSVYKIKWRWNGMIKEKPEKRYYPTQKPVGLFIKILQKYSNQNDTILDCFIGSGTTAIACEQLGRKWIAIDKSLGACQLATKRIKREAILRRTKTNAGIFRGGKNVN